MEKNFEDPKATLERLRGHVLQLDDEAVTLRRKACILGKLTPPATFQRLREIGELKNDFYRAIGALSLKGVATA
jgi:hypothetical protein